MGEKQNIIIRGIIYTPVLLFIFVSFVFAENPDSSAIKIKRNKHFFEIAAGLFDINPKYLAAIIHVERTLNYNWTDDALDILIAKAGRNSSIGFCQVKLKTAYWIEFQLSDSTGQYYPGDKYNGILPVSNSPNEIITKLVSDSLNILYAAAYLRIIQIRWEGAGFLIDGRPDIIGTLYSTGLFYPDGRERLPRLNPIPNPFGLKVIDAIENFQ